MSEYKETPGWTNVWPPKGEKTNPKHADYRGSILLENGEEYWVSVYARKMKDGRAYFRINLKEKDTEN